MTLRVGGTSGLAAGPVFFISGIMTLRVGGTSGAFARGRARRHGIMTLRMGGNIRREIMTKEYSAWYHDPRMGVKP